MIRKLPIVILLIVCFSKLDFGQPEPYTVKKASFSSNKYDEFSPVYFKNGLVFCSNRNSSLSNHSTSQNKGLFKIYYTDTIGKADWESTKLFSKNLTTILNDGPVSFNRTRDTIYFSRNQDVSSKLSDISSPRNKLGIYSAILINGQWVKVRELRINNEWYNVTTPCLSPDDKKLFFASDKPGGFGGSDLYYSNWKDDRWDDPVNMGPVINTKGNESYPFINQSGKLFFSSDGHPGLGGKDIYFSIYSDTSWQEPVHLDAPINSQYDDFGLVADSVMNEGYFSSNRDKSIDIYHFKTNFHQLFYCQNERVNQYCFKLTDEGKKPIDESYLQYEWSFGDGTKTTGQNVEHCFPGPGKYSVKLDIVGKKSGRIFFSKLTYNIELKDIEQPIIKSPASALVNESIHFDGLNSFFPGSSVLTYSWSFGNGERTTGATLNHSFKTKGEYTVKLGLILRNNTTGAIFEACTSKQIKVYKDKKEVEEIDPKAIEPIIKPNILNYDHAIIRNIYSIEKEITPETVFQVEILTSKTRLNLENSVFNNVPKKYSIREMRVRNENLFSYIIDEEMSLMSTYATYNELVDLGYKDTRIRPYTLEDPASKDLNTLKKVFGVSADLFFNQNDYSLTTAGKQMLDQIIGFMAKYPLIKLEIGSHTDNLGSPAALTLLSQKRAETMVNYLINYGVNSLRLVPKGYGGSRPLIPNSVEADRKLNRRVDFIIIK
jgi:outer membrane protein OmpA-like peptidoglycan-associated protein/chitodextrinase